MTSKPGVILAVDPGTERWGLAVVRPSGECVVRRVEVAANGPSAAVRLAQQHSAVVAVVGDRTASRLAMQLMRQAGISLPIVPVNEHGSTLEARQLYYEENPPGCLLRLLPRGLLSPPVPIDAYAAHVLALRYLSTSEGERSIS